MKFSIITAADLNRGIGIENRLPWQLKGDLKHFQELTTKAKSGLINAVIMGRKTWESLPMKPLKDRLNVVLSRSSIELPTDVILASSLDDAFEKLKEKNIDQIFIIGGQSIYSEAINHPDCEKIYLTEVLAQFPCDAFFPSINEKTFKRTQSSEIREEKGIKYRFTVFERI